MSEVTAESTASLMYAGNTAESLLPINSLPSAADLDAVAAEQATVDATAVRADTVSDTPATEEASDDPLDDENTFDVSRAEFSELQDAFLRLKERIDKYNQGSPHRI